MEDRPRSTIVIWLVAAALAAVAAVRLIDGGDAGGAPPVSVDGAGAGAPGVGAGRDGVGSARAAAGSEGLYVHVVGAVRKPGLIRVPDGTRVARALARAGGPTGRADLTLVNLAAPVQDGQQIVVPVAGRAGPGNAGGPAAGSAGGVAAGTAGGVAAGTAGGAAAGLAAPGGSIQLSTATPEQLDQVDGIGPTLAARIVEYRDAHGGFRSLDELAQVEGIGEKRLATLRDALQP